MFKKLFFNNPKTTTTALIAIIVFVVKTLFKTELSENMITGLETVIMSLLTFGIATAKDGDKT